MRVHSVPGSSIMRRFVVIATLAIALLLPAAAHARQTPTFQETSATSADGSLGAAARTAVEQGYLVPDQEAYERSKARANAAAGSQASTSGASDLFAVRAPVTSRSWDGLVDPNTAPSDSTGAIGNTRYIELVNRFYGIYARNSNVPIATGTLNEFFNQPTAASSFDPQIIWDPQTRRFYYVGDTVLSASDNRLSFGFSKTAAPNNGTSDWCHYDIPYGSILPDYPKLGDSSRFVIIGVNSFAPGYVGSDLIGVSKPPAGTTCPSASTFDFGIDTDITGPGGAGAFTPVPANQIDTAGAGYVVSRTETMPSNHLVLHRVTANPDGTPKFQAQGSRVAVGSYSIPNDAQQQSPSVKLLDTLDARPTQAVSAIDANHVSTAPGTIWTQHAIAGDGVAQIRWYEIDPNTRTVVQSDRIGNGNRWNFNGAISPDRAVNGPFVSGGSNMVLGFSTSGPSTPPQIRMVSKIGAAAQSAPVTVRSSPGNYVGFDCAGADNSCRWGDYSAATPDPIPPAGTTRVWLTNQYASGGTSTAQANWLTRNWAATP